MAKRVKDANLETREARSRLDVRGKPHYRTFEKGVHIGYRRLRGRSGTWCARFYIGKRNYQVESLGEADDFSDADGGKILNFWQAQTQLRERMVQRANHGANGSLKVREIIERYIENLEAEGRSAQDTRYRVTSLILPKFGDVAVADLTTKAIKSWHADLAKAKSSDDKDMRRRRKASANRVLTILKAALNKAWADEEVKSDDAWRKVKPFKDVDRPRDRYLAIDEATKLMKAADLDFRKLIQGGLLTGARYGQLTQACVQDFDANKAKLKLRTKKGDGTERVFYCTLTDGGVTFFRKECAGKASTDPIFTRADGSPWKKSHQVRRMKAACKKAKIAPIGFHGLRHSYTSHAIMNGMPVMVGAQNLGHTSTRMIEKHYAHLDDAYVRKAVRDSVPSFAPVREKRVRV